MFNAELDYYIGKAQTNPPEATTPKSEATRFLGSSFMFLIVYFLAFN
jgi:hypothetical protein